MGSKFDFRMSRSDYDDLCFDLTDDEHAVLDLRRRGMHNADIAAELYCSERTVNRRVRAIKSKLGYEKASCNSLNCKRPFYFLVIFRSETEHPIKSAIF